MPQTDRTFAGTTKFESTDGKGIYSNEHLIVPLFNHKVEIQDSDQNNITLNFLSTKSTGYSLEQLALDTNNNEIFFYKGYIVNNQQTVTHRIVGMQEGTAGFVLVSIDVNDYQMSIVDIRYTSSSTSIIRQQTVELQPK